MSERFIIVGAGGHGRVVQGLLTLCGDAVVGFVDRAGPGELTAADGTRLPIAPESALGGAFLPWDATAIALGIGDNVARLAVYEEFGSRFRFPARFHPAATIGQGVILGDGSFVLAAAVVNLGAHIGRAVIINTGTVVEHDCRVDDGVHIAPGAVLCGGVSIGRLGLIGAGATIVPGRRIGAGAVVGAGSVVIKDVSDRTTVVGNPARPIDRARLP